MVIKIIGDMKCGFNIPKLRKHFGLIVSTSTFYLAGNIQKPDMNGVQSALTKKRGYFETFTYSLLFQTFSVIC